jgi:branched-chain amino acid transport system ATP-binding protein
MTQPATGARWHLEPAKPFAHHDGMTEAASPRTARDEPILRLENVHKSFAGFSAVSGVSLDVRRGTIHALIGPNGAGKTTLFNLATRFLAPTSGKIWFEDRDITSLAPNEVARLGMVRSFQISAVFLTLSARENVRVALQAGRGDALAFWRHKAALNTLNDRADALLADVGLGDFRHRRASELAYGQRRALERDHPRA